MPQLDEKVAKRKAQEPAMRRNPEIDAKIDDYMAKNPGLVESYNKLSKDDLIRKLVLSWMNRSERATLRNEEIRGFVAQRPELQSKIEAQIKNVPQESRDRAFINAAKRELMQEAMRPAGVRI